MNKPENLGNRNLSAVAAATMLASVHYGIGFILGTGEKAHILGAAGSLYAVSCGLGLVALALLAGFYWQKREPLWTLLGHRYGRGTRRLVLFLSWAWMVGVVASQLLGGAYIVTTLRFNPSAVLLLLALVIMLASSLPVERAARLFQVLIGGSSLALLYALTLVGGPQEYVQSVLDFGPALCDVGWSEVISTVVATVLITLLGMDFHQFVVQTRSVREARLASVLAGIGLLLLAFLPSSVVIGASRLGVIPATIDGKQTVPAVLLWVGQKTSGLSHKFLG